MPIPKSEKIWFNGQFVPWDEAQVHVTAHALHYGSSIFEGIRCYSTAQGPAIFCLDAHVDRLYKSAKIYRTEIPYSPDQLRQAIIDTVRENKHQLDSGENCCGNKKNPAFLTGFGQHSIKRDERVSFRE